MRQLTLIRHAKSSWNDPALNDFDRPLNARGLKDLPGLAQRIVAFNLRPDLILCSGAKRTRETARGITETLGLPFSNVLLIPELYEGCYETLLNTLQNQPDTYPHIMLIGHNPGLTDLGHFLTQEPVARFPTAAIMHIHLSITRWSELAESCGTQTRFDYPSLHKSTT
ncbi:MAG: SixA phosphatase family protein [Pontibacterium sp.]